MEIATIEQELYFSTLEQQVFSSRKGRFYTIGVPFEIHEDETRVGLTPQAVAILVEAGHDVRVESGAGAASGFSDLNYSEVGALIVDEESVFDVDILFKIQPLKTDEIQKVKIRAVVFSLLLMRTQTEKYFQQLMHKKITAIAYEKVRDEYGNSPIIDTLARINGNACPLIAGEYFSSPKYGMGRIIGSIAGLPPTEIVIIGSGKGAETAAANFLAMNASVKIFDNSLYRLQEIRHAFRYPVYTSIIYPDLLHEAVTHADLVIASVVNNYDEKKFIISEEIVKKMKKGSMIIDIGIEQESCVETSYPTTHKNPVFVKHNVLHYCVLNISSRFPHSASRAISNILVPILTELAQGIYIQDVIKIHKVIREGTYLYNGVLTDNKVAMKFGMYAKRIDMLLDIPFS